MDSTDNNITDRLEYQIGSNISQNHVPFEKETQAMELENSENSGRRTAESSSDEDAQSENNAKLFTTIRSKTSSIDEIKAKLQSLLKAGAAINTQNARGKTILHIVVEKNYKDVVKFLLEQKEIRTDITDNNGQRALNLAKDLDLVEIIQMLETYNGQGSDMPEAMEQQAQQSSQGLKRPHSPAVTHDNSKRLRMNDEEENAFLEIPETDLTYSEENTHRKGGLANSLHGNIYQLKLQMLFLKRALDKDYRFNLGTEVEDAGKFDDIVFKYKSGEDKIRFVQAKHKQDETKKITARDLLTDKDDEFSLQKYFISYRAINKTHKFSRAQSKDFILYTNIDFDENDLTKSSIQKEAMQENDEILDIMQSGKSAVRFKLMIPKDHKLYEKLRETSHLFLLAKQLASHISNNKKLELRSDHFKLYHGALIEKVFLMLPYDEEGRVREEGASNKQNKVIKKCVRFRDDFLNDDGLSEDVSNFRHALKSVLVKGNDSAFKTLLKGKDLSVALDFDKVFKLQSNPTITKPKKLAKKIAEFISEAQGNIATINKNSVVIRDNIDKIAGHVLVLAGERDAKDGRLIKFSKLFLDDEHDTKLPGNFKKFKNSLKLALKLSRDRRTKEVTTIDWNEMEHLKFKINNFKTCEETAEGQLLLPKNALPDDNIEDVEIEKFFKELTFAVNQPNEVELGEIVTKELGTSSQFNLLDADLVAASFQSKMLNWFKEKRPEKGKEGVWLNKESGQTLFGAIQNQVRALMSAGTSLAYIEEVKAYDISFNENSLANELGFFLSGTQKILHIIPTEATILSTITFLDALKKSYPHYKKHDSYIFQPLCRVLPEKMQDYLLKAFTSKNSHDLFIINCATSAPENVINSLYQNLCKNLFVNNKINNKKLILIANKGHTLARKFAVQVESELEDKASFHDLTTISKRHLLDKNITLQGEGIFLKKLYFNLDGDKCPTNEQLNQLDIDTATLVQLITDPSITIGNEGVGKSHLEGAYTKLYDEVNKDVLMDILQKSSVNISDKSDRFFLISGLDQEGMVDTLITNLVGHANNQHINEDLKYKICQLQNIGKITLADSAYAEKDFKQFYYNNTPGQNLYWICLTNNKFILRGLFYPMFLERRFAYPKKETFPIDIKAELLKIEDDTIFYFTGIETAENLIDFLKAEQEKENLSEICHSGNVRISKLGNQREFSEFMDKKKGQENKTVYWLHIENNKITWRDITREKVDSDKKLVDTIRGKSSILIDKPGMGKSTTLSILSKEMLKSHWVIFITLRDWQEKIAGLLDYEKIDANAIVNFLSETNNLNQFLEKNLAKFLLSTKYEGSKPLLLVFDGFDEIRSNDATGSNKKIFIELLEFLKKEIKHVWISAREHDADVLRDTLSIFDIKFKPLDETLQMQYFKNVWRNSLTCRYSQDKLDEYFVGDNCKFKKYYERLSKEVKKILEMQDNDFMGIPLTLRLFADGFRAKFIKFINSTNNEFGKDFDNLNMLKLYKEFIHAKFKIFYNEKTSLSTCFSNISAYWFKEKLIKLHCRLALEELFGKEQANQLLGMKKPVKWKDYLDDSDDKNALSLESLELPELFNIGIVRFVTEARYEFLHRTLAEYFASEMFAYVLQHKNHNTIVEKYQKCVSFLKKNITKEGDQVIYKFLEAKSQQDTEFNDIWEAITTNLECDNLLGNTSKVNDFIIDKSRTDTVNVKSLQFLREVVHRRVNWRSSGSFGYNAASSGGHHAYECYCVKELINECIITSDIKELEYTLVLLAKLLDRSVFGYFNDELTAEKMILIISHYIFISEQRQQFNVGLVERCFREMVSVNGEEGTELEDSIESVNGMFDNSISGWLTNKGLFVIFQSRLLTHKIAERFNYFLDTKIWDTQRNWNVAYRQYISNVFYKLIIPLLILKESSKAFAKVDSVVLLDMFQAFANAASEISLHERFIKSLFYSINESLSREKFSEKSFYVSIQCLIVLKKWNLQISYKNNCLYLDYDVYDDAEGFHKHFTLKYETKIVQLLRNELVNPGDLEMESRKVANVVLNYGARS